MDDKEAFQPNDAYIGEQASAAADKIARAIFRDVLEHPPVEEAHLQVAVRKVRALYAALGKLQDEINASDIEELQRPIDFINDVASASQQEED